MKKPVKQNNQSFRSQTNRTQQANNKSNTEKKQNQKAPNKPKQEELNQRTYQIIQQKILVANPKQKRKTIHWIMQLKQLYKQRATTDQNPYIYIKQCEMNNCFDRKQQNKNNDAYKKNWKKASRRSLKANVSFTKNPETTRQLLRSKQQQINLNQTNYEIIQLLKTNIDIMMRRLSFE
ncbi:Hypothetical_protein [Hexamita inflata]|uniref:Hypothetical_protein n=1 Tax=Hexamita inflata TaxID=28002 RepID=A0ABP1HP22_9EUKA